ncbi:MAG TPA: WYL domain-containing protein [bacterium]|nr:WYL domain-containing protein [bacterium]
MARRGKQGRKGTAEQPNYEVALRMARMVSEMPAHPFGWELGDAAEYLRVSERTVRRYVKALGEEFTDDEGGPLYGIEKKGEDLRLVKKGRTREGLPEGVYHLISVHLSLEFFRMLGENVVALSVEDVFDRARKRLSPRERDLLANLDRKFFTAPAAMKDYSGCEDVLEDVIKAIVFQNVIKIVYRRGDGEVRDHTLEPYTLMYHKGGFYLIARSAGRKSPVYFLVENILSLQVTRDKFAYPKDYRPEQMLDGAFGIFSGPAKTFKLKFSPALADYIACRRWHKSQTFRRQKDGSLLMTLKVADTEEVRSWIRSFGRAVKVMG